MNPVSATSHWIAAARAIESARPDALFSDPFAAALAGDCDKHGQAYNAYLSIRTKFFDDALFAAVKGNALTQVVLLGAGMDARAFRFDWPINLKWFEVDQAEVLKPKQSILDSQNAKPPCQRTIVCIDLSQNWTAPLIQAGFDPSQPAAFLLEGLLIYLKAKAVQTLLTSLSGIAAPGSWLFTDMASADFLKQISRQSLLDRLRRQGCPWQFGVNDPDKYIEEFGWQTTYARPGEPAANFGRWSQPIHPRGTPGFPQRSFLITARR